MKENEIFDTLQRIGTTPRDQLAWLVGLVEGRAPQTPEDWGNLHREIRVFAMHAAGAPSSGLKVRDIDLAKLPPRIVATSKNLREGLKKAPWGILYALLDVLEKAAQRQRFPLPSQPQEAGWHPERGGYVPTVAPLKDTYRDAVLRGVARRIFECGHLLKVCQAPAKLRPGRKRKGEPKPERGVCGRLFVAKKRTQLYCSAACLSRTVTRKKRAGKKTRELRGRRGRKRK